MNIQEEDSEEDAEAVKSLKITNREIITRCAVCLRQIPSGICFLNRGYKENYMNILFISLGCDKNLVDSEVMLGLLDKKGYAIRIQKRTQILLLLIPVVLFMMQRREYPRPFLRWQSTEGKLQSSDRNRMSGTALSAGDY